MCWITGRRKGKVVAFATEPLESHVRRSTPTCWRTSGPAGAIGVAARCARDTAGPWPARCLVACCPHAHISLEQFPNAHGNGILWFWANFGNWHIKRFNNLCRIIYSLGIKAFPKQKRTLSPCMSIVDRVLILDPTISKTWGALQVHYYSYRVGFSSSS